MSIIAINRNHIKKNKGSTHISAVAFLQEIEPFTCENHVTNASPRKNTEMRRTQKQYIKHAASKNPGEIWIHVHLATEE
jgi:hypothetical protein